MGDLRINGILLNHISSGGGAAWLLRRNSAESAAVIRRRMGWRPREDTPLDMDLITLTKIRMPEGENIWVF